jgi:glycerol-3-phosphate acyltransferase PlsY
MNSAIIVKIFGLPLFAYILGSVSWGFVLTRIFASEDIRQKGSGNIGATNVNRIAGPTLGALTLAGDLLKGALPVYLAFLITGQEDVWREGYLCLVAFLAFWGHLYPLFFKFKTGGKGVATAAGCFLVISPTACFIAVLAFILFVFRFNHVSSGSLAAAVVLPVAVWARTDSWTMTGFAVVVAIFICFRHKSNIRRLLSGTEPAAWEKKKT